MRCFIAMELPDAVREHLVQLQGVVSSIAPKLSLTKRESLHLTLRFLGETSPDQLDELMESLRKVHVEPMKLRAEHLEIFPPRGPLRIVAAGLGGDVGRLGALQRALEQRAQFLGYEKEDRAFRPHVTFARAKGDVRGDAKQKVVESIEPLLPGPEFVANEFVLMRSHLKNTGAEYEVMSRFSGDAPA